MDSTTTALLCLLGVFGLMSGAPLHSDCEPVCDLNHFHHHSVYHLVLELQNSSIAPWTTKVTRIRGRPMEEADCASCTQPGLISKPIYVQLYQTKRVSNQTCHCPFRVAVGCTCVARE